MTIIETEDRCILRIRDSPVEHITYNGSQRHLSITAEDGTLLTAAGDARLKVYPDDREERLTLDDLAALQGASMVAVVAWKTGGLRVAFSTGDLIDLSITVPHSPVTLSRPEQPDWSYQPPRASDGR